MSFIFSTLGRKIHMSTPGLIDSLTSTALIEKTDHRKNILIINILRAKIDMSI